MKTTVSEMRRSNASLIAIVGEGVISRFSFGAINLALPLYARHLGLNLAEIGILLSINTAVALFLKPMCGRAIDRFGKKRSFSASLFLRSLVPLLFSISGTQWMLYGSAGVHGVSKSVRDPSVDALIVEHSRHNNIGSAFAWYSTAKSVSGSVGKGAAGIFLTLTASNFSLLFLLAAMVSASSLLAVMNFVQEERSGNHLRARSDVSPISEDQDKRALLPDGEPKFLNKLLPFLGFGCFVSGVGQMLDVLFPILAVEYGGMTEAQVGILFMVAAGVVLLAGPAWGWLSDHFSRNFVLFSANVNYSLASAVYLVFPVPIGLTVGRLLDDVGKAAFRPTWGALLGEIARVNPKRKGLAVGYMGMGKDAGEIAGPIIASVIWTIWGVPILLGTRIALAIGAEVYSWRMLSKINNLKTNEMVPKDS